MSKSLRVKYLLWIDEKDEGPYAKTQIIELLAGGKITKQTLCLPEDGNGDWQPVGVVPGLLGGAGPRSRRRNPSVWIGAGILILVAFLWLLGMSRTKHQPLARDKDRAGSALTGPTGFPYVGAVKIRISNMGDTIPTDAPIGTSLGAVTNNTFVEFEVTSGCDAFIPAFTQEAQFLDSWGKVIAECFFQVRDIKPYGRNVGTARVMNLPREKLNGWRLDPEFPPPWPAKWISWHTINIQRVEGSNTLADVTAEIW